MFHFQLASRKHESSASGTWQGSRTDGTSAHEVNKMARAHTTHETDCSSPARRCSSACCYLAIASLLVACGGYVATECVTGPSPAVLAWDTVVAPNLSGYRIYYGTAPGTYLQSFDVASSDTTVTVMGLSSGTIYYFAATAYDMSIPANESFFSNEVCKRIS